VPRVDIKRRRTMRLRARLLLLGLGLRYRATTERRYERLRATCASAWAPTRRMQGTSPKRLRNAAAFLPRLPGRARLETKRIQVELQSAPQFVAPGVGIKTGVISGRGNPS
jgi:hypothetical protein